MDERRLGDEELARVSGGSDGSGFSPIAEEFAWRNRCANCPHKNIYRPYSMCLEVYAELLQAYAGEGPIDGRCKRRA